VNALSYLGPYYPCPESSPLSPYHSACVQNLNYGSICTSVQNCSCSLCLRPSLNNNSNNNNNNNSQGWCRRVLDPCQRFFQGSKLAIEGFISRLFSRGPIQGNVYRRVEQKEQQITSDVDIEAQNNNMLEEQLLPKENKTLSNNNSPENSMSLSNSHESLSSSQQGGEIELQAMPVSASANSNSSSSSSNLSEEEAARLRRLERANRLSQAASQRLSRIGRKPSPPPTESINRDSNVVT